MNRKKLLKELKKNKKSNKVVDEENYLNRFVGTIFGILIIGIVGYILVGVFLTKTIDFKGESKEEEKTEATIDNTTILAGNIFSINEEKYYVLIYNVNEKNNLLKDWVNYFKSNNETNLYVVDSENKMNSKFIVDKESNTNPSNVEDLKIISPTLMIIENKEVTAYIEGIDEIKNELKK